MTSTASEFIPHWEEHPWFAPVGPHRWIFYAVIRINGNYYPVAAISYNPSDMIDLVRLDNAAFLASCSHAVSIFSDPNNRHAIQVELDMAASYFEDPAKRLLPVIELPDYDPVQVIEAPDMDEGGDHVEKGENVVFPFTSACLRLGAALGDPKYPYLHMKDFAVAPLSTTFHSHNRAYGMVVLDISDLDKVSYGIVAFKLHTMVWIRRDPKTARSRTSQYSRRTKGVLEEDKPRKPLSAAEYMTKFNYGHSEEATKLESVPIISPGAFDVLWPPITRLPESFPPLPAAKSSLWDMAIATLVQSTAEVDQFDMSIFDQSRSVDKFHGDLKRILRNGPPPGPHPRAFAQLLCIIFDGCEDLYLGGFKGLPITALGEALKMKPLENINRISLCVETTDGTAEGLSDAISQSPTSPRLFLLYAPPSVRNPGTQNRQAQFYTRLMDEPWYRDNTFICARYIPEISADRLLSTDYRPANACNIRDIFFRIQTNPYGHQSFHLRHIQLHNMVLTPEVLVARFLHWLLAPDDGMVGLACGPNDLHGERNHAVSPLPIWGLSDPQKHLPVSEALYDGRWSLLISREMYRDDDPLRAPTRTGYFNSHVATYMRYALVRANRDEGRDGLQVAGVKEFLQVSAPKTDLRLADRRLQDAARGIQTIRPQGVLPSGKEWLSILELGDQKDILQNFFESINT